MFKWHAHSAIGRSRPIAADVSKVADGIAASLRQFSVSLARSDDAAPRQPRSQSARDTFNEVSSLGPRPRVGIDARALAAKGPQSSRQMQAGGFTITKTVYDFPEPKNSPSYRGRGGGGAGGARGAFAGGSRGGARGGVMGGRGGARGGARGGRGRGGRATLSPKDRKKANPDGEYVRQPLSEGEIYYLNQAESGFRKPYEPTTDLASLAGWGAPTISSTLGVKENLISRFSIAAGTSSGGFRTGRQHLRNVWRSGVGMFESAEQRQIAEAWQKNAPVEATQYLQEMRLTPQGKPWKATSGLSEEQKKEVLDAWVAGQHEAPKVEKKGDVLSTVGMMMSRNETYLPEDARKFEEKLRSLIPGMAPPQASRGSPRPNV